jgi:hypothetical protein
MQCSSVIWTQPVLAYPRPAAKRRRCHGYACLIRTRGECVIKSDNNAWIYSDCSRSLRETRGRALPVPVVYRGILLWRHKKELA